MRSSQPPLLVALVFLLSFGCSFLGATGDSTRFLLPTDSIVIQEDRMANRLYFHHRLEDGQSLYGVARFYGLRLDDLYFLNPLLRGEYNTGDLVRIPIPTVAVKDYVPYDSIDYYVPIFYVMPRGQTLFGLTHRTLKLPSEEVLYANNPGLSVNSLKVGQYLFIGWLSIQGITAEMQGEVEDPYVKMNTGLRQLWQGVSQGKRLTVSAGKAAWTKDGDRRKFMALHRTAPLNSILEVMDKRTGKVLYCRVVGRIPEQVYDYNVKVVLSPLLVRAFGVHDRFFYVQVKHY